MTSLTEKTFQVIVLLFSFFYILNSSAEPWLANRFSKNCAACHSPGRINVSTPDRRCTLNCQGCHVNPNGGGIRNQYGQWNQKYWLASTLPPWWRLGTKRPERFENETVSFNTSEPEQDASETPPQRDFSLIPENDPLKEKMFGNPVIGGGDLRYVHIDKDQNGNRTRKDILMTANLGFQVRPADHISFVTEASFANGDRSGLIEGYTQSSFVRSAYLLIDDLPYNSHVMSGLYRPMFGNYDSDHRSLLNTITGFGYRSVYRATSLGIAPNVPFFNIHFLEGDTTLSSSVQSTTERGFGANAGARFVSYGASAVLSYMETKSDLISFTKRKMTSLALGASIGEWIPNVDIVKVSKETSARMDEVLAWSFQNKYRIWRETYIVGNFSSSNSAQDLSKGNSSYSNIGLKSFILSGVEIEGLYSQKKDLKDADLTQNTMAVDTDEKYFFGQLHFFF